MKEEVTENSGTAEGMEEAAAEKENAQSKNDEPQTEEKGQNKLQKELEEAKDKYLRLYSEFENFRKRTQKEKADLIQHGNKDLLLSILPVYDDFERALGAMEKSNDKEALAEGVKLIFHKFGNVLQQAGLKPIEAKGQDFDPELHEALTQIPAPDPSLKGKVVDEIQKGYQLNDKIIRYSKVVVGE